MVAATIFDFWDNKFLTVVNVNASWVSNCVNAPNFFAIGQTIAQISRFWDLQNGGRRHLGFLKLQIFNGPNGHRGRTASLCQISSAILDCDACVWTTDEGHLLVFITVKNLVGIDAHFLICRGFWSFDPPKWEAIWTKPQKAHPCASPHRLSHHAWKSVDGSHLSVN